MALLNVNSSDVKKLRRTMGKDQVVKVYGDKAYACKYPDMSGVVWTEKQQRNRLLFKQAHEYAREVLADPERAAPFKSELKPGQRLFNQLVGKYMRENKVE